ncbi:MaoC family dehydratase [Aromatoleum toluclasticum]|uniref:MaoC family dehydratase n=1 Tax=Aromatoleum toluclasticum TaxID=92003 RepID=UPI0006842513|nr:MaoC family dehydratase [Aromatoleum toluclasticum]
MAEQLAAWAESVAAGYRFARRHTFDPQQASAFAHLAGDDNPIHHDGEFASGTRFGGLIVSATHTTALMMGLVASHFAQRGTVLGLQFSVDLLRPVGSTETVTLEWVVKSASYHPKGGQLLDLEGEIRDCAEDVRVRARGRVLVGATFRKQAAAASE